MARRKVEVGWSDPALLILGSLASGPKHGYAMVQEIQASAGVSMGPGTLYGALPRLEQRGLVRPLPGEGRRRPYEAQVPDTRPLRHQPATGRADLHFTRFRSERCGPSGH